MSNCPKCDAVLDATSANCPSCNRYVGAPNVRSAGSPEERKALRVREIAARELPNQTGCSKLYKRLGKSLSRTCVVVCVPAKVARDLVLDRRMIYVNYETLLEAGVRVAASPENDRRRALAAAFLFGRYGSEITYGALSFTSNGLPTYGHLHLRLRDVAVQDRVSFLEMNSYDFYERNRMSEPGTIPPGHQAVWKNRHILGLVKLAGRLKLNQKQRDWQKFLVYSDGQNRDNDDFIEAQIYGFFNIESVETIRKNRHGTWSKTDRLDADVALDAFKRRKI